MAQQENQLDREKFCCSICLDLLEDPVTTGCGHSFCMRCINIYWDNEEDRGSYRCPQCRQTFTPRPVLVKSTMLAVLVEELKKTGLVCTGRKRRALQSCLDCLASCEKQLQSHFQSATFKKHRIRPLRNFETAAVSQVRGRLRDILSETETKILQIVSQVNVLLSQPEPETRADFLKYSQEIPLDPNTANKHLLLSEGNRKVTHMTVEQSYSDHPDRFIDLPHVLSRESLTGPCYWEVEVDVKHSSRVACVAVTYKNISRAGSQIKHGFGLNDRSWSLYCYRNSYMFCHSRLLTKILGPLSSRVGVYLDHSSGVLSFYSVSHTMNLLQRVQTTFTEPLYAGAMVKYGATAEFCKLK